MKTRSYTSLKAKPQVGELKKL